MAAGVTGVKKLTRLPSGSRNSNDRFAPRHRGGLLDEVLDEAGQVLVYAVHVVDEELDDHGAVVRRAGGAGREQRDGAGATDRQGGVGGAEFGEVLGVPVAESRRWWCTSCCRWSKPC